EIFLQPSPFRDVTRDGRQPCDVSTVTSHRGICDRNADLLTVLSNMDGFVIGKTLPIPDGGQILTKLGGAILGQEQLQALADRLLCGPPVDSFRASIPAPDYP